MFQNIGPVGLLLIVIVALILFGPNKLPELGRAFGRTLREFKEGTKELLKDEDVEKGSRNNAAARETRTEVEGQFTEVKQTEEQQKDRRLPD
ncbi:twin-arginine translocase TatA/TatE family subunit [Paenibacillus thermotolerans]|uniref:twin-arginine translocase TatA/TatE family subunit n=1 Tax=Paenibacillus thermotolerans TaxID=3027807 RepID=UPI002368D15E|nr:MULTISPECIES: twin-arginine translocase TatA/TatE family subunit [unclassified Paenibacillus]